MDDLFSNYANLSPKGMQMTQVGRPTAGNLIADEVSKESLHICIY